MGSWMRAEAGGGGGVAFVAEEVVFSELQVVERIQEHSSFFHRRCGGHPSRQQRQVFRRVCIPFIDRVMGIPVVRARLVHTGCKLYRKPWRFWW